MSKAGDEFSRSRDEALLEFLDRMRDVEMDYLVIHTGQCGFESGWDACWKYLAANGFPDIRSPLEG